MHQTTEFSPEDQRRHIFDLYTSAELAAIVDVSEQTIAMWRNTTTGPKWVRLGRRIYYTGNAIHEWIAANIMRPDPRNDTSDLLPDTADTHQPSSGVRIDNGI